MEVDVVTDAGCDSVPDAGHDDRRYRELVRGANTAGRMELGVRQMLTETPRGDQVEPDERDRLEHDTQDAEGHGVEQRQAEAAGPADPDAGEHDRSLAEETRGQCHRGV